MSAPLRFDLHRGDLLTGVGAFLETIVAETHRHAKHIAALYPNESVVVLPHRKPNEKLERAVRRLRPDRTARKGWRGLTKTDEPRAATPTRGDRE